MAVIPTTARMNSTVSWKCMIFLNSSLFSIYSVKGDVWFTAVVRNP